MSLALCSAHAKSYAFHGVKHAQHLHMMCHFSTERVAEGQKELMKGRADVSLVLSSHTLAPS
eukprot:CAMPEP_0173438376 /NCGR_PEP_ID=MMETSP1357-20121228/20193_1 /TAXON_ID=77926 /ORGANISM="Hemiselmis rufescens, Strain PCC563" /LENGTH=61 /DNA_ID=CAMNT_0014403665 /DNA_START=162 /DNA_END=344 /DNA_ORIENTATION=+